MSAANHSDTTGGGKSLLDTRHDPFYRYLFGQISPVMFVVTLAANSLIILVLSRPAMRSPTNLVLLSMALADLLTLVFPVPWYFYLYSLGYFKYFLHPSSVCYLYRIMTELLPTFLHTASIWCTLLLAGQRYIYICHPTTAKVWCTNQRVLRAIVAIFLLAFLMNLSKVFDTRFEDIWIMDPNSNDTVMVPACGIVLADWASAIDNLYFGTYYVFRLVFVHLLPCFLLVIFNVFLYNALKRAEITRNKLLNKQHHDLHKNGSGISRASTTADGTTGAIAAGRSTFMQQHETLNRKTNRGRDANSTTFMLIVVVTVFLIVEIPLAVGIALHFAENMFNINLVSDQFLFMIITFSNFFIIISYPLNFAIYCGMSRAFRETFQQMFLRCLPSIRHESASSSPHTQITSTEKPSTIAKAKSTILPSTSPQQLPPPPAPPQQPPPGVIEYSPPPSSSSLSQPSSSMAAETATSSAVVTDFNGNTRLKPATSSNNECAPEQNQQQQQQSPAAVQRKFSRETMV